MNFLLIAYYYPPLNSGGSKRPFQIANYLKIKGHQVTVLTGTYVGKDHFVNGKEIRVYDPSHNFHRKGIRKFQFFLLRLYQEISNRLGICSSIYSWWMKRVKKRADKIIALVQPDYILTTYPPVEDLELGIYLSKNFDIPLISDYRDGLLFEPIESRRIFRFLKVKHRYEQIERESVLWSKHIITASSPISKYFEEKYKTKVSTLMNGFCGKILPPISLKQSSAQRESFTIIHTGQLVLSDSGIKSQGFFNGIRSIIKAYPSLRDKLKILLVGRLTAGELKEIRDLIATHIVVYKGSVDMDTAIQIQKDADLLLTITPTNRSSAISTKIFEYLRTGIPILALTKGTQQEKIVKETSSGWSCHPEDTEKITRLLKKILFDTDFYHSISPNRQKIQEYAWENQARKLDKIFNI